MDPVFVNNNWRTKQGFFLTSGREAHGEIAVFNKTTELLMASFKDKQIRSANVLDANNLALVEDIVNETLETISPLASEQGVSSNGLVARTWFTAMACLGAYHEKIKQIQGREGREGRDGREGPRRAERPERGPERPQEPRPYEQHQMAPDYDRPAYAREFYDESRGGADYQNPVYVPNYGPRMRPHVAPMGHVQAGGARVSYGHEQGHFRGTFRGPRRADDSRSR